MKTSQVVRVAVSNNFNCTKAEFKQLNNSATQNPDKYFFINSNINTPDLNLVNNNPYKVVVTANPNLIVTESSILKILKRLDNIKDKVAFVRVKYIPENTLILTLIILLLRKFKVVITNQRFNSLDTLKKYSSQQHYKYSDSRFRLAGKAIKELYSIVAKCQKAGRPVWICDKSGKGCSSCGLCSKLTIGKKLPIYSMNLSTSGVCPYSCVDCYAKTLQKFITACGHRPIRFDVIKMNNKQKGRTKHILEMKNKLK